VYEISFCCATCSPEVIKRDWIKDALEGFVELKLVMRKSDNNDNGRKNKETRNLLLNLTSKPKKDKEKMRIKNRPLWINIMAMVIQLMYK
jgi:hypothetical protein